MSEKLEVCLIVIEPFWYCMGFHSVTISVRHLDYNLASLCMPIMCFKKTLQQLKQTAVKKQQQS
jgi:hypothetical protein